MAIFTTSGTFMLLFLAALQSIGEETDEAAQVDGANAWQRFWYVALPMLQHDVHRADARHHRHLAGVRPDLHRLPGWPGQDDADPGLPVV